MPFRKSSKSSNTERDARASEIRGTQIPPGDSPFLPERTDKDVREPFPPPSSGDYPTNPTTEHRYGANIGTGVYDPNAEHVAHTSYTISEADFRKTAPDSGLGIHARQYHGPETGAIPIGTTTYVRSFTEPSQDIDPATHARSMDSEAREGLEHKSRAQPNIVDNPPKRLSGEPRMHDRDVQRERGMALGAEQDKAANEKVDTKRGSTHGLFGHGRQRDAAVVGRDTDATDFGARSTGKVEAGRQHLGSTGSERDRMVGSTAGRERLAKEQDSKLETARASQVRAEQPALHTKTTGPEATRLHETAYTPGSNAVPGTGTAGVGSGIHGQGPEAETVYDRTGRTGASAIGDEGQRSEAEAAKRESKHLKSKPSLMDKIVGHTEAAIGKSTGNANMLAKGEKKALGLERN